MGEIRGRYDAGLWMMDDGLWKLDLPTCRQAVGIVIGLFVAI